jgi:hypothetical protein
MSRRIEKKYILPQKSIEKQKDDIFLK